MLDQEEDLKNFKFICPNNQPQIIEELAFSDMKNHIENCQYLKLSKCIQCGAVGSEAELLIHIKECPEAIILCEYCNEETERKYLNIHLNNCEKVNQINLDSSGVEDKSNNEIECGYVKLFETKIDNLSNNDFVVSSEKEENISDKKSEINHYNHIESKNDIFLDFFLLRIKKENFSL